MFKKVFSLVIALMVGFFTCVNAAETKIAVVDMQKVLAKSAKLQAFKKEQEAKRKEIANFIKTAGESIKKESDVKKKEALAKKYDKELQAKQEANLKASKAKAEAIDNSILATIAEQAKVLGYDYVLPKGVVLYGADDITDSVIKVVK